MAPSTKVKPQKPDAKKANGKVKASKKDVAPKKDTPKKVVSKKDSSSSEDSSEEEAPTPKAKAVANGKGKIVKKPEPSSSDSDDSEEEKPKAAQVKAVPTPKKAEESSDDSSDDDDEVPAPKTASTIAKVVAKKAESSSDDSDSEEEPAKPAVKAIPAKSAAKPAAKPTPAKATPAKAVAKKAESSDDDSDDEDSEEPAAAKKDTSDLDDSDDDDDDVEMADAAPAPSAQKGKRKADEELPAATKKAKSGDEAEPSTATKTIFVGKLSWNVDNDWLATEFAECGEVVSARVQMDRNTGKSRGFGYVEFTTSEAVEAALLLTGKEIDGRPVNVDKSIEKDKSQVRDSRAKAYGDSPSEPSAVLFVGNLDFNTTEDSVWEAFGEFGEVKSVRLPTDRESGRPKGFGYVEFVDVDTAKKAFGGLSGGEIDGRSIRLDYSQPRDDSGGGFRGGRGFGGGDRGD
ncbi:hypothetical protein EUX98_g9755, partial [Antrodiella citrinella]